MNTKFQEAIDESIRASETHDVAHHDLQTIVRDVNLALQQRTKGLVQATLVDADEVKWASHAYALSIESDEDNLILCYLLPSSGGYPVELFTTPQPTSTTMCADREALEWRIADLLRNPQFGHQLKAMMNPS